MFSIPNVSDQLAREIYADLCRDLPPPSPDTPEARTARDERAMAAVAARRTAARNVFFAAKRDAAIASVASLDQYFCFVDKHENHSPQKTAARRRPLKTIA